MNFTVLEEFLKNRERRIIPLKDYRPAAVLVPLVMKGKIHLLVTKRANHLKRHAGEVSFPGGKVEWHDESRLDTAVRETEEEVGVPLREMEVYGPLDDAVSMTGFHIMPYVGSVPYKNPYPFDRREIESLHLIPLNVFMAAPRKEIYRAGAVEHPNFVYEHDGVKIFGVTAFIIKRFVKILDKSGFFAVNKELIF